MTTPHSARARGASPFLALLVLVFLAAPLLAQRPLGPRVLANSELLDPDAPASPHAFACQPDGECLLRWGFGGLARIGANGAVRAQRALAWEDGWGALWPKPGGGFAVVLNREREAEPFTVYEPWLLDFDGDLAPQGGGRLLRRPDGQYPFSYFSCAAPFGGGFVMGHGDVALGAKSVGIALSFFDAAGERLRTPVVVDSLLYRSVGLGFTEEEQWIEGLVVDPAREVLSVVYGRRRVLGRKTGLEGVFLRRYSLAAEALGEPLGGVQRLLAAEDDSTWLTVTSNARGEFALVWTPRHGDPLIVRRLDRHGRFTGPPFEVNPDRGTWQILPSAALDDQGRLAVAWEQWYDESSCPTDRWSYLTARLRVFDRENRSVGPPLALGCGYGVGWPKVHFSGHGVLLAAWEDDFKSETLGDRVWVRRFAVEEQ